MYDWCTGALMCWAPNAGTDPGFFGTIASFSIRYCGTAGLRVVGYVYSLAAWAANLARGVASSIVPASLSTLASDIVSNPAVQFGS